MFFCLDYCPRNNIIASGSYDESIRLWDVFTGNCLRPLPSHSDPVSSIHFSERDPYLLVSGSFDTMTRIWNVETGNCLRTFKDPDDFGIACVKFSPNGRFIISSTLNSMIRLWDIRSDKPIQRRIFVGHTCQKFSIFSDFFQKSYIISGSEDKTIKLWNINNRDPILSLEGHEDIVLGLDCHPTIDSIIASGSMDNTIKIWKIEES